MAKGLARAGFDIDLRDGGLREAAFANVLFHAKVECKSDEKCRQTGNVFIEYLQHGRPSGIATTEADFWAIEFAPDCWLVLPTAHLKDIARDVARQKERRVKGGDGDNFEGVLVPLVELIAVGDWKVRRG
jgi:hypothetical protein